MLMVFFLVFFFAVCTCIHNCAYLCTVCIYNIGNVHIHLCGQVYVWGVYHGKTLLSPVPTGFKQLDDVFASPRDPIAMWRNFVVGMLVDTYVHAYNHVIYTLYTYAVNLLLVTLSLVTLHKCENIKLVKAIA